MIISARTPPNLRVFLTPTYREGDLEALDDDKQNDCLGSRHHNLQANKLICVALATGMKCLPQNKVSRAQGNILHDCHAEILALRGFNRWIVDECFGLLDQHDGIWIERRTEASGSELDAGWAPFQLQNDVRIHMYCSEAPCGDASMEILAQRSDDGTPWDPPPPASALLPKSTDESQAITTASREVSAAERPELLHGRAYFSLVGIVRRKPARADAPPTVSKSCSDKLAMKQCTGLLSALPSLLINPTKNSYLQTLVLPDGALVKESVQRAFGRDGRMSPIASHSSSKYSFRPFKVLGTARRFKWEMSRTSAASNICAIATAGRSAKQEVLINGVLQGRKIFDQRGASCLSRRMMWTAVADLAVRASLTGLGKALLELGTTYEEVKKLGPLAERESMKKIARQQALKGWQRNIGDEEWSLGRAE